MFVRRREAKIRSGDCGLACLLVFVVREVWVGEVKVEVEKLFLICFNVFLLYHIKLLGRNEKKARREDRAFYISLGEKRERGHVDIASSNTYDSFHLEYIEYNLKIERVELV